MEETLNHLFLKRFIAICSLLIIFTSVAYSQDTVLIQGKGESWANKRVDIWYYHDYISQVKKGIGTFDVATDGSFEVTFELLETRQIFVETGALEGVLFVEPGAKYKLKLPDYREMTKTDSLNPFFTPFRFYFGLENSHALELNHLLAEFDLIYDDYLLKNFRAIKKSRRGSDVDTLIVFLDSLFEKASASNDYFRTYKKYKEARLRQISYIHDDNYVIRDYFDNEPVAYFNPSYFEVFNTLFDNYIERYSLTYDGRDLAFNIARAKSYQRAMADLKNNLALSNDTLRELVLIKGLRDALYENDFPKSSLFQTLDSVRIQSKIRFHKEIVKEIVTKRRKLLKGTKPPKFSIKMGDTLHFQFPSENRRFVLLNFINIESFAVQKVLPQIKQIKEKHKDVLQVISINVGSSYGKAKAFFEQNQFDWLLLNGNDLSEDLLEDYNVKAYPSYYLVDGQGNLALNPTPGPESNFEYYFFKILKRKEREMYRNQE
jgi:hypothetical protein